MKYLKYILLVFILLLSPNVFAANQTISNKIEAIPNFGGGTYYATQPATVPVPLYQNIGTRYNGKLSLIEFYLDNSDWNWSYNKTYTITLNMATEDWRNNFMGPQVIQCNCDGSQQSTSSSSYVSNTFRFVSYKTIKFNFKLGSTMGCKTKFRVYSSNTSSVAITGVSNYNLSSVVISDTTSSPTPTPVGPSPTSTASASNQDVINNQTQNTQDIINNNTQNTSDIIENNNQNTQIIDDSLNTQCKNGPLILSNEYYMKDNYYLDEDGNEVSDSGAAISTYFVVKPNSTYTIVSPGGLAGNAYSVCLYDSNKNILSASSTRKCQSVNDFVNGINIGAYAQYMRITIPKRWFANLSLTGPVCNNWEMEAQNYLMDNSDPNISDNEFTSLFDTVSFNDPLSYLLTLPVQLINTIVSNSNTCSTINFGSLYGTMLSFPCINIGNIVGSQVWDIIDVILSVSLLVVILKNLYQTFANLLTLGGEKEAREKFSMPTPMEFLSIILGGDK